LELTLTLTHFTIIQMSATQSVQTFGKKKTATAVALARVSCSFFSRKRGGGSDSVKLDLSNLYLPSLASIHERSDRG